MTLLLTLRPGLALDGFEDVLDRELEWCEAVVYPVSSEWILLVVREWCLLEGTTPTTLVIDGGVSMSRLWFCSIITATERLIG